MCVIGSRVIIIIVGVPRKICCWFNCILVCDVEIQFQFNLVLAKMCLILSSFHPYQTRVDSQLWFRSLTFSIKQLSILTLYVISFFLSFMSNAEDCKLCHCRFEGRRYNAFTCNEKLLEKTLLSVATVATLGKLSEAC